jgi:hypothetical protein
MKLGCGLINHFLKNDFKDNALKEFFRGKNHGPPDNLKREWRRRPYYQFRRRRSIFHPMGPF